MGHERPRHKPGSWWWYRVWVKELGVDVYAKARSAREARRLVESDYPGHKLIATRMGYREVLEG